MQWVNSERKEFAPSRVDPFGAGFIVQRSKQEVIKVAFLCYMEEMCEDVPTNLNKLFHLTLKVANENWRHFNFLVLSFEENKA